MSKNVYKKTKKGEEISSLGLGTVQFGCNYGFSKEKSQKEVDEIIVLCSKNGINFLDTARDYDNSERKIGNFLQKSGLRNKFFVATKLSKIDYFSARKKERLKQKIFQSLNRSCKDLRCNSIDLLQMHQTDKYLLNNGYFWDIISLLKKEKKISSFGVSVYEVDILKETIEKRGKEIDFVQLPYNIFDRRFEKIFGYIRSNNIEIICRSVFLKGIITAEEKEIPKELKEILKYKKVVSKIAKKFETSIFEICLAFVILNSNILTTIIGVNSKEELEKNIKTANKLNNFNKDILREIRKIKVKDNFLIDPRRWKNF